MAETVVSDAAKVPQDEGYPGISDGNETFDSAGLMALLGQAAQSGSYVRSDSELTFTAHDGTNDTVDVTAGVAYISLAGVTVDVQSTQADVNDGPYDTTITTNTMPAVCVILPSATTVNLQDSTLSSIWLAYDTDGTGPGSSGSVYLRSDDTGSVTEPSHPNVKLGESNPDSASSDVLENRFASPTFDSLTSETFINRPDFSEDSNSPFTATSSNSITCNLSETFDFVTVYFESAAQSSGDSNISLQCNGVTTSDYQYIQVDGTNSTGNSSFSPMALHGGNDTVNGGFRQDENQFGNVCIHTDFPIATSAPTAGVINGESAPLTQLTFSRSDPSDWTVEVFGRTQ